MELLLQTYLSFRNAINSDHPTLKNTPDSVRRHAQITILSGKEQVMETELDFENIHSAFRPRIHRYLTRLVGVKEAEDLTQEVFVKVSQGLKTFRGESQLSTWVYRIATNAAIDMKRSPGYRQSAQSTELKESLDIGSKAIGVGELTPSTQRQVERKEMNKCIRDFVDNLPQNYRSVFVLSELEALKTVRLPRSSGLRFPLSRSGCIVPRMS